MSFRLVKNENLTLGKYLPKGCALSPSSGWKVGDIAYYLREHKIVSVVGKSTIHSSEIDVKCNERHYCVHPSFLFHIVESDVEVKESPSKLPEIGERFWIQMECKESMRVRDIIEIYAEIVGGNETGLWIGAAELGLNKKELLSVELAELENKAAALRKEINKLH